jgi:peptidyl-prolyl cis-trans isomerase D
MAILGNIRKRSGLAVIFVGVAIAAFVLGDIGKRTWKKQPSLGIVAGEKIISKDFEQKVEENIQFAKQGQKKENLTSEEVFQVRQNTWSQKVNEIIMDKAYNELGLTITEDELTDQIQGPNPHKYIISNFSDPNTGQFSRELLVNFLQTLDKREPEVKKQVENLITAIKADRLNAKYMALVGKGYYMPKALVQKDYQLKNVKAKFNYVAQSFTLISDSAIKLTDKDYQAYFDKNKLNYEQEESRDIDYVIYDVMPSNEDREEAARTIDKLYKDMQVANDLVDFVNFSSEERYDSSFRKKGSLPVQIDSIMFNSPVGTMAGPILDNNVYTVTKLVDVQTRPDSLKAAHILISYANAYGAQDVKRTKEQAKKLADSIFTAAKSDKLKFDALVAKYTNDASTKDKNGDFGWFADGNMIYSLNKAILDGKVGDITRCESPLGYHIINVTGKTTPNKKVRVALVKMTINPSTKTRQDIYSKASAFAGQNRTTEAFNKAVAEQGLNKRTKEFTGAMDMGLPGIETGREVVRWAFSQEVKAGDVSDVKDIDGKYVIANLKKVKAKGFATLEDIKQSIEPNIKKEKKIEMLAEKMAGAGTTDLAALAQKLNARVDTAADITFFTYNLPGAGREPRLLGEIFSMNRGETSKPIKGENFAFVVKVNEFTDAPAKTDFTAEARQLENSFNSRISNSIFRTLEKLAKVEDNRVLFY